MKIVANSGNIGTPAALELARQGHHVAIAVRVPRPNPEWDRLGIRQVPFDLNDPASMANALEGCEAFLSVSPLVKNLSELGAKAALAAEAAGVRRIVRASAQGAAPDAGIQLGRMHYANEKAVEESGIPFTILRPGNFMQNYLGFGTPETIKTQNAFYTPLADAKLSPIDTRDISAVAARVLVEPGHEGKRYELTGGESLSCLEIAALFSEALGREITSVSVSLEQAAEAMAAGGAPAWLVPILTELNAIGRAGYLAAVAPDVEQILKRKPITFAQFIRDHLAAFQG